MRKHSLIGLIFILLVGLLYNSYAQSSKDINLDSIEDEQLLMEAIKVDGFQMEELNTHTSTLIPNTFLTIEELEKKQKQILGALNIEGEIEIINMDSMSNYQDFFEDPLDVEAETILQQRVESDEYNEILTIVPNEEGNVTLIKLLSTKIMGKSETHIILDITKNKGYKEIVDVNDKVRNILKEYGSQVETTINLSSAYEGKLTKDKQRQIQNQVFDFLNADKLEVLEEENFTSITGYSELINSYINYGGKDVNLQLAMRYSKYEDKTYLLIGNPLITTTY